jgi:hypothetical protein
VKWAIRFAPSRKMPGPTMNKLTAFCASSALLMSCGLAFGQARPACVLLETLDLKPLLGAGHAAPAPYADNGCMVKSKTPDRLILLQVAEKPNAELKQDMAAFKKTLSGPEYAKVSTVAAAPQFGPEAFSAREKGAQSAAEIHAVKGTHAVSVTLNFEGRISEPVFKQLGELTGAVLAKLP